jgi:hypothetical protein
MPIYRGSDPIAQIFRGANPIAEVFRGSTLVWTSAPIFDPFNQADGWLIGWINELLDEDPAALISDQWGNLLDGLNNFVGSVVAFVQALSNDANAVGTLVTNTGTALVDAYCAAWGGTAPSGTSGVTPPPDGLIGLINGIPLIGPYLSTVLVNVISNAATAVEDVEHIVGSIPVVGNLAAAIGLIPAEIGGTLAPPINYVIDQLGNVIGTITCGRFTPTASSDIENIQYVIGTIGQNATMLIPDGLLTLDTRTSRMRYPTQTAGDDGWVEIRPNSRGDTGMTTQMFRRYANSGAGAGVGINLLESHVSIVKRIDDTDTLVKHCGTYNPGDRLRLVQAGTTHTLFKNGQNVGAATFSDVDTGIGFRSIGMVMQSGKELFGPKKYSPRLDYMMAL